MINLRIYPNPKEFLHAAQPYLEQREVVNSLMLGVCMRMRGNPNWFGVPPYLAVVEDEAGIAACAMMTPPTGLVLASERENPLAAFELIADSLQAGKWALPDVSGPNPLAGQFAELWARRTQTKPYLKMAQGFYELRAVNPVPTVPGQLRPATKHDIRLAASWMIAFEEDSFGSSSHTAETARAFIESRVRPHDLFLWDDDGPVSMAMRARPTAHGVTVSMVYTPLEKRGRGYATACVAALSQRLLNEGYQFCTLFTDLANPTSNSIYQKIGYKLVCQFDKYGFAVEDDS